MSFPCTPRKDRQPYLPSLGVLVLLCLILVLPATPPESAAAPAASRADPALQQPLIVNERNPLGESYVPADLRHTGAVMLSAEAADSFDTMTEAARAAGVTITAVSGYRSYAEQHELYLEYIARYGYDNARAISAPAGASEHQAGLAVDIGNPDGSCSLLECFEDTPAGRFAAQEGWRYGFIIRYPKGATDITGYAYEPWHLRYVGPDVAAKMRSTGQPVLERFTLMGA